MSAPLFKTVTVACSMMIAAPAVATPPSSSSAKDPNEKICEDITMIGSRLAVKRVCATRAEWAEKRRRDREMIDTGQRVRPCTQSESSTGIGSLVC